MSCFYVDSGKDRRGVNSGISYISIPIQSIYFEANHENMIDTVFREYALTVSNVAKQWGEEKLSDKMKADLINDPSVKVQFVHAVYPRILGKDDPDTHPQYFSKHLCIDEQRFMDEGYYRVMPYIIGRYETHPESVYGISPAMQALSAIRRLNELSEFISEHTEKTLDPPSLASTDIRGLPLSMKAGVVNYGWLSRNGHSHLQMLPPTNGGFAYQEMARLEGQIRELFFLDLFQILGERASRSAAESMEKTREKGAFMASLIGCLQAEFVGSLVKRELDILELRGVLPPVYDEGISSSDVVVDVDCTSPLFRYQQADGVEGEIQGHRYLVETARMEGNERLLLYHTEAKHLGIAKKLGTTSDGLLSSKEVDDAMAKIIKQREEQNQRPSPGEQLKAETELGKAVIQKQGSMR